MKPKETKPEKLTRSKKLILTFLIPFFLVSAAWTIIHYIDITDGLEKGRGGPNPNIKNEQILLDAFKSSFLFAIPAGLIGLAAGYGCFKDKADKDNNSV